MRPNVLIVVLDTARQDAFEPYGACAGSTPTVAQLAARGRALDGVYATGCWTAPSHASMFTGLMPRAAGLSRPRTPMAAKAELEGLDDRLLAPVLRRAGYATAAASANPWVSRQAGFDAGFDVFEQVASGRKARFNASRRREVFSWVLEAAAARADDGAGAVERLLEGWLAEPVRRPFLWFVNLLECHSPYLPPRPYGGSGLRERLRAADAARRYYTLAAIWRVCCGVEQVPRETLERLRRFYDASIRSMDDWLGRVLERLDAAKVLDETLVVVLSDHGENFGEGGLIGHAMSLDDRLLRVPFVAAGPGAEKLELASLAHLPRLLAEVTELPDHPWTDGPPSGFGVAQFDPSLSQNPSEMEEVLAGFGISGAASERYFTPLTCVVKDGLKLLVRGEREELYDLAADPEEICSVAVDAAPAGRVAELRDVLRHPSMAAQEDPDDEGAHDEISDKERLELEERMRLLGYL